MKTTTDLLAEPSSTQTAARDVCSCSHCGLTVPPGLVEPEQTHQFCCEGCRAVWNSLHACGLERYYEIAARDAEVKERRSATVTNRKFGHFDQPTFVAKYVRTTDPRRFQTELRIDGLHCGACVWLLESLPRITKGLIAVRVDLSRNAVFVDWDPAALALGEVARRFDRLGYQLLAPLDPSVQRRERHVDRAWLVRIGVAAVLASNAMAVAFALYGGHFATMSPAYRLFFQWISVGIAIVALIGPGRVFFANAIVAIRTRTPHIDIPVATGIFGAVLSGFINTVLGEGSIYCESATMLVFLLLVGRFVQYRQQRRARQQVELITSLVPSVARRRGADGAADEIPVEALVPGDIVDVPAGEIVPCDGTLLEASARFDLSLLTGESRPQAVEAGADVWAGTRAVERPVVVQVRVAGAQTRAGRLLAMVSEAAGRRPPIVELTDRIAGWFLLTVLAAAAFTLWWSWPLGHSVAVGRAVALLVVTCPCALGLATPLAVVAAIGKAARVGVLVKGGDVLERLATPGTIVLDKTGTITEGRVAVTSLTGDPFTAAMAAAVERSSAHPIATAIVQHALDVAADALRALPAPTNLHEVAGRGIEGRIESDARGPSDRYVVRVGNEAFVTESSGPMPRWAKEASTAALTRGESPIFVGCNGEWRSVYSIGDPIRAEAKRTIAALRSMGWRVTMCSGDHADVARAVGRAVGLGDADVAGNISPEGKVAFVRDRGLSAPVVMVGDGVNDLAAMAAADVGVAVRNGAQSAMHVADACLARPGLTPLVRLLNGSHRTLRAIRVSLVVSLMYNATGGVLAFLGLINPLVAAILMPVSGLTVLTIALRLPRFEFHESEFHEREGG